MQKRVHWIWFLHEKLDKANVKTARNWEQTVTASSRSVTMRFGRKCGNNTWLLAGEICLWCLYVPITLASRSAGSTQWNMLMTLSPARLNHIKELHAKHIDNWKFGIQGDFHLFHFIDGTQVTLYCNQVHFITLFWSLFLIYRWKHYIALWSADCSVLH